MHPQISTKEAAWAQRLLGSGKGSTGERQFAEKTVDRVRGMVDLPLTPHGLREADHLGQQIRLKGGVDSVISTPLKRGLITAGSILRHNPGAKALGRAKFLEPAHYGELEGQPSELAHQDRMDLIKNPDMKAPGVGPSGVPGESLNEFLHRFIGGLLDNMKSMAPNERRIAVTHYSNIRALRAWLKNGAKPDMSVDKHEMMRRENAPPASMFKLRPTKVGMVLDEVGPNEKMTPGLALVRHGATPWNDSPNLS